MHCFAGIEAALKRRAAQRTLQDVTVGPVLTWTTKAMLDHVEALCAIPGARIAFGGRPLKGHTIPECYGAIEPTAVYVPLEQLLSPQHFGLCTTEVFGPVQVGVDVHFIAYEMKRAVFEHTRCSMHFCKLSEWDDAWMGWMRQCMAHLCLPRC